MSETSGDTTDQTGMEAGPDRDDERRRIAEVQEQLDAQAEGEGLAAEAGAGEEMGLAEG